MRNRTLLLAATAASLAANLLRPETSAGQTVVKPWSGTIVIPLPGIAPLNGVSSLEVMPPHFPFSPPWSGEVLNAGYRLVLPAPLTLPAGAHSGEPAAAAHPVASALARPAANRGGPAKVGPAVSELSGRLAEATRPVGEIAKTGAETARDLGHRVESILTGAATIAGDAEGPPKRSPTWTPHGFKVPPLEGLTTDPIEFSLLTRYGKMIQRKAKAAWEAFANPYKEPASREHAAIILGEYWGGMQAYEKMLQVELRTMSKDPGVSQGARTGIVRAISLLGGTSDSPSDSRDFELLVRYLQDTLDQNLSEATTKSEYKVQAERYLAQLEREAPEIKDFTGRYRELIDLAARETGSYDAFTMKLRNYFGTLQALAEDSSDEQRFFARFDHLIAGHG